MEFLWASDLHLDHATAAAREALDRAIAAAPGPIVVLTGDTSVGPRLVADLESLSRMAGRPLYFVLGNHDYYGSDVAAIRDAVVALDTHDPILRWLPPAGVVALGDDAVLIGVDGWADGRHGDPLATPLRLNDDRLIREIATQPTRRAKLAVKRALADADAGRLATLLERAVERARTIVVATHVPPFVEALPASGHLADPHWLPLLVCGATGDALRHAAAAHPHHRFLVLCGHTHVATDTAIADNLRCIVAGAGQDAPTVRVIRL